MIIITSSQSINAIQEMPRNGEFRLQGGLKLDRRRAERNEESEGRRLALVRLKENNGQTALKADNEHWFSGLVVNRPEVMPRL